MTATATDQAVNRIQGKRQDARGKWIIDDLEEEEKGLAGIPDDDEDILKISHESGDTSTGDVKPEATETAGASSKKVKETKYYDALGLPVDVPDSKIKRAYYIQAKKMASRQKSFRRGKTKISRNRGGLPGVGRRETSCNLRSRG